ncbi:hypothetical protein ACTFIW_003868 [Dictyostelium discoideum]
MKLLNKDTNRAVRLFYHQKEPIEQVRNSMEERFTTRIYNNDEERYYRINGVGISKDQIIIESGSEKQVEISNSFNLKVNTTKCAILKYQLNFLGYTISNKGRTFQPEKCENFLETDANNIGLIPAEREALAEITYRECKKNFLPDLLSRLPNDNNKPIKIDSIEYALSLSANNATILSLSSSSPSTSSSSTSSSFPNPNNNNTEVLNDAKLKLIYKLLLKEILPNDQDLARKVIIESESYAFIDNILVKSTAHIKNKKNQFFNKINERFYWRGMIHDIKNYIATCKVCNSSKLRYGPLPGFLIPMENGEYPFHYIGIDFITATHDRFTTNVLVIIFYKMARIFHNY